MLRTSSFALMLAFVLSACSPSSSVDVAAEEQAIRERSARWQELDKNQDAAGVASLFLDDGAVYWENRPATSGAAALEAFFSRSYADNPSGEGSFAPDQVLVAASGDLAVELGAYENPTEVGRYVTIHRKVNGEWKVQTDISVDTSPSGGAPAWAREKLARFYEHFNAHDGAALAATYGEDARVGNLEEGGTGRAAIAEYFEAQWADGDVKCEGDFDEFGVVADIAAGWGRDKCTTTAGDGTTTTSLSNWMVVYEQQSDGSWEAVRDRAEPIEG